MFDSHDDDLWEVPSIDVDVPAQAAVPVGEAVPAPEAEAAAEAVTAAPVPEPTETAAPAEAEVPAEDESSTDGYAQAAAEAPEDDGYDMDVLDGKLLEHFGGKIVR
jgi:ATP-dependent Lon protease